MSQGVNVLQVEVYDELSNVVASKHEDDLLSLHEKANNEIVGIPCATACNC
jgi:hypothetical protein